MEINAIKRLCAQTAPSKFRSLHGRFRLVILGSPFSGDKLSHNSAALNELCSTLEHWKDIDGEFLYLAMSKKASGVALARKERDFFMDTFGGFDRRGALGIGAAVALAFEYLMENSNLYGQKKSHFMIENNDGYTESKQFYTAEFSLGNLFLSRDVVKIKKGYIKTVSHNFEKSGGPNGGVTYLNVSHSDRYIPVAHEDKILLSKSTTMFSGRKLGLGKELVYKSGGWLIPGPWMETLARTVKTAAVTLHNQQIEAQRLKVEDQRQEMDRIAAEKRQAQIEREQRSPRFIAARKQADVARRIQEARKIAKNIRDPN